MHIVVVNVWRSKVLTSWREVKEERRIKRLSLPVTIKDMLLITIDLSLDPIVKVFTTSQ